jgi:asparagine synthase (glutamine-hydrolysing)
MCGIYFSTKYFGDDIIKEKLGVINFRGPDYSKFIRLEDGAILGHNRLAIIDLDARSNQPFYYQHLWIVFNGEIYNYIDLKNKLIDDGYKFTTSSDTEVICAAYLKYGEDCVKHLNGMFSFVIYDEKNKNVFAAKDRLGKKPLFYRIHNSTIECASQPGQLAINNNLEISSPAVEQFLTYGYIPSPDSIYNDVFKLSGGYCFNYKVGENSIKLKRYWDLNYQGTLSYTGLYQDALLELENLLTDAVKIRLLSDVPLGAFLSGGIDSSLVVALASKVSYDKLKTFSVKFDEARFDESSFAAITAKHLGTDHTTIECNYKDGIDLIQKLPAFYDEPFGDSSAIPSMLLSKATKQHVTVALSGDGGDEGFLGYNHFDWVGKAKILYKIPLFLRNAIGYALSSFGNYKSGVVGTFLGHKDMHIFITKIFEGFQPIINNRSSFSNQDIELIKTFQYDYLQKAADINIKLWLENDSNVKVDRASMSAALEVRSPLLDYRIIEFARTLPVNFRYQKGNKKRILKDLVYKHIPKELLDRPKSGFAIPFEEWFRKDLKSFVYETITKDNLSKIPVDLNVKYILDSVDQHMSRKKNFYSSIWYLIVLINWMGYTNARKNYYNKREGFLYS